MSANQYAVCVYIFLQKRADTTEHYNSLGKRSKSERAAKNKGQHMRPGTSCYLTSLLDTGCHAKNGLCRNACQQLANVACIRKFLGPWKSHPSGCRKIYIRWSKYPGSTQLKKMVFQGNAARELNYAMQSEDSGCGDSDPVSQHSSLRCVNEHKGALFDSLGPSEMRLLLLVCSDTAQSTSTLSDEPLRACCGYMADAACWQGIRRHVVVCIWCWRSDEIRRLYHGEISIRHLLMQCIRNLPSRGSHLKSLSNQ